MTVCFPRVEATQAPLQPQQFLPDGIPYWGALTPGLFSTEPSQSRLRTPEPPARWLSLAEDRHLPLLKSQPRCPPPGLRAGQLPPTPWACGPREVVPRGPLCLQPMGPMPLGPQGQVIWPGSVTWPSSQACLWALEEPASGNSPEP